MSFNPSDFAGNGAGTPLDILEKASDVLQSWKNARAVAEVFLESESKEGSDDAKREIRDLCDYNVSKLREDMADLAIATCLFAGACGLDIGEEIEKRKTNGK